MTGRKQWQREFTRNLASGETVRLAFDLDHGQVTSFLVQLECWIEGRWRPVVRYDTAHGQAHRDLLDWSGHAVEKVWLPPELDFNSALTLAERDVVENAATYRAAYEESKS
jgi:hypothetical protein